MAKEKITIILNGKKVRATNGERLVDVIRRHDFFLCAPCHNKYLSESGHCGMCLVGARRKPTDEFTVVFACTATAKADMEIDTENKDAVAKRYELFSLCLLQHPLDCSKCDKVDNCFLHKFYTQTKFRGFTRVVNGKLEDVQYDDLGPNICLDRQKCIGCKRCVRFCRDILGEDILGFMYNDHGYKEISLYPGKTLDNNYSLNLVDLCPAGAMRDRNNTFQPMAWELEATPSISTESSVGVNTYVLHKDNKIFRIVPRENEYVNDEWIPNSARVEHKYFENKKRLTKILKNGQQVHLVTAATRLVQSITSEEVAVVCSGNMSLEDQFMLRRLLDAVTSRVFFLKKNKPSDGFLISEDGTPNLGGAILNNLAVEGKIVDDLHLLRRMIQDGQCKRILSLDEEIFAHGISYAMDDSIEIFYIGTEYEKTAKRAFIAIPTTTVFESMGSFINRDWRLQKFYKAVNAPNANIFPMWYIFSLLRNVYANADGDRLLSLDDVWKAMVNELDPLANVDFHNMDFKGILLKKD